METANELITGFITNLESRRQTRSASGNCLALVSDSLPAQTRVMTTIRNEICPHSRCSDVDRAIIGASLGG